jgi:hypothetical protein
MGIATLGSTITGQLELFGSCAGCKRRVLIDTAALEILAQRYGRDAVLYEVMQRIVSAVCGGKADLRVHVPGQTPIAYPPKV